MGWDIVGVLENFERIFPERKVDMATRNGIESSRYKVLIEQDLHYV